MRRKKILSVLLLQKDLYEQMCIAATCLMCNYSKAETAMKLTGFMSVLRVQHLSEIMTRRRKHELHGGTVLVTLSNHEMEQMIEICGALRTYYDVLGGEDDIGVDRQELHEITERLIMRLRLGLNAACPVG
jgi:hypothetical protein